MTFLFYLRLTETYVDIISVSRTIETDINEICALELLDDKTIVICGDVGDVRKVKTFNLETGKQMSFLDLKDAYGFAAVKLGETSALAVSFRLVLVYD